MGEKNDERINLYLPKALKERIKQIADSTHQKVNTLILEWCKEKVNYGTLEDFVQEIEKRVEALEKAVFKK